MINKILTVLLVALCTGFCFADSSQPLPVGYFDETGEVQLYSDVLDPEFPDGTNVAEFEVREVDDFLYLARKSYNDGDCHTEIVPLVDRFEQRLTVGSDPGACPLAFISNKFPVRVFNCLDDGCKLLPGVVPLGGDPIVLSAHCDNTELSDFNCRCHINRGQGEEVLNSDLLCKTELKSMQLKFPHWMNVNKSKAKVQGDSGCIGQ